MAIPKEEGGLGFRNFQDFNSSLLAKQLWRLITQPNLLMCKVLKSKYYPRRGLFKAAANGQSSWLWKSWMSAKHILLHGLRFQVGDGKSIRIWDSPWLNTSPTFKPVTSKPQHCQLNWVSELMNPSSKLWNSELILNLFFLLMMRRLPYRRQLANWGALIAWFGSIILKVTSPWNPLIHGQFSTVIFPTKLLNPAILENMKERCGTGFGA